MNKYAAYFAVEQKLRANGFDYDRLEVVEMFTQGKKHSLTELSEWEYREMLRWMNSHLSNQPKTISDVSQRCDKMRKKIIAILCKMGYKTPQGKADMNRIGAWAIKYGSTHRTFNAYSYKELTELVTQAELMYNKFLKAI